MFKSLSFLGKQAGLTKPYSFLTSNLMCCGVMHDNALTTVHATSSDTNWGMSKLVVAY